MSEPRDVLAKAIRRHRVTQRPEIEHFAEGVLDHLYHGDADAGLAALRAEGWAVVRTADVKAVTRYLDSQRDIWDERASRACDSLEEAIR